ncbi:uncharacterized protein LOC124355768 [Homalodisca vitripennis]|uniref:uncharacterized protein LOC124355768 n=1 Tax=Homalodisca vitripennis TaxID=197043 RepID=UPI001EE9F0A9|nr:uncharacterized protein LOC124355768 [Homalodisca vitripennis]
MEDVIDTPQSDVFKACQALEESITVVEESASVGRTDSWQSSREVIGGGTRHSAIQSSSSGGVTIEEIGSKQLHQCHKREGGPLAGNPYYFTKTIEGMCDETCCHRLVSLVNSDLILAVFTWNNTLLTALDTTTPVRTRTSTNLLALVRARTDPEQKLVVVDALHGKLEVFGETLVVAKLLAEFLKKVSGFIIIQKEVLSSRFVSAISHVLIKISLQSEECFAQHVRLFCIVPKPLDQRCIVEFCNLLEVPEDDILVITHHSGNTGTVQGFQIGVNHLLNISSELLLCFY